MSQCVVRVGSVLWLLLVLGWRPAAAQYPISTRTPAPSSSVTPLPNLPGVDLTPPPETPMVPQEVAAGVLLIEDFSRSTVGQFPAGWRAKGKEGKHFYSAAEEKGVKYIKVDAIRDGSSIFRQAEWEIKKYPVLEWKWRARLLPEKGNENSSSRNDCAVSIYVVFPVRWFVPDTLKYTWSTTLPIAQEFANGGGKNKVRVLRSGSAQLGEWIVERRNIYDDYKRRFRREPPNVIGLGMLTDADQTRSLSSGDYAYFKAMTLEAAKGLPLSTE